MSVNFDEISKKKKIDLKRNIDKKMYELRRDDEFLAKCHINMHRNYRYFRLKNGRKI